MYRKLVFVLTMFAVAFGSLSQVQAALASSRPTAPVASAAHAGTPASIATLRATGAVRAATAGRETAHDARFRTEQRQGSLSLSGDRRATGRASVPKTTSAASLAVPKTTSVGSPSNGGCQIFAIPGSGTFTVGQSKTVPIFTGPIGLLGPSRPIRLNDRLPCTLSDGGGTLPSGVTFTDSGYNYATFSGTPAAGTTGTYPLTITAANGGRSISTLYFTLTVNQAPGITSPVGTTFTAGQPGTFTVTSTGVPKAALSETGTLPTGVTFTDNGDGTATLAGTPAPGSSGPYPLTITATNGVSPDATQAFTLTVNHAPGITSPAGTTFTAGQPGTFTVTSTGVPNAALSETGTLPTGVTFTDNGDGTATLAGTPAPGSSGPYPFTITATNGVSPDATQAFTLTVNHAPGITSPVGTTFTAGQPGTFTVTSTGVPNAALSETGTLPTGVTFTDNGDGTATLAGTPAPGSSGPYPFTITATNGVSPDATQNFTLTVNHAPGITSRRGTTFTVGQPGTFTVTSTGVPNATLSEKGTLPTGVTFTDNGDGTATIAGTPTTGGPYPFTITATNGVSPDATQNFTLTVNAAACQITSSKGTTFTVGHAGTFTVTTTGYPLCQLSETGALPTGVTFTDNRDGTATLSGTPAAGSAAPYPFTITARNGVNPAGTQAFILTVNQVPGITSPAGTSFTTGQAGTFTVTTSGVPNSTLSETGALPAGVTFTDNKDGTATLAGIPGANSGGTYPFTITATNGVNPAATQPFVLTVNQACQITSDDRATFDAGQADTFTVATTGVPNCGLLESGNLPSGVTFTDNGNGTAAIAGTPTTGGVYLLRITAGNGIGGNATQLLTLIVLQKPQITSPADTTFTVGQPGTFTVTTSGVPTPGLSENGALPTGVTFTDNGDGTAALAGTPAAGTAGTYTFTITATDSVIPDAAHVIRDATPISPDATQSFTLTVNQAPGITSSAGTTFTAGQAGTFTVTTTGAPTPALSETGALPSGVTFKDNGDGTATLAGTPSTGGTYKFTITATNGVSPDATQSFTLTVNQAPGITSSAGTTFTAGQAGTFTVTTTGAPTPALSETGALPSGVTFKDNGDGTATLAGTPSTGGTYKFTITATNGVSPDATQSFTLTVNQAPGITSSAGTTFTAGQAGTFTVTTTGAPIPALSEKGALPRGVRFKDNGDGTATLAGTPAPGTGGTYTFRIAAKNGVSPDAIQSFTLTVVGLPAAPSGLKATSRGRTVSLTWTNHASAPSAATAIQIQRSTDARFTTAVTNTVVGPNVTSHRDTVVAGKRYYYRVRAHNAVGFSSWSNVASP